MTKGEILAKYEHLSAEDQHTFDRWLRANAVVASIFGLALVAMALNSSGPPGPATATAMGGDGNLTAPAKGRKSIHDQSPYELMNRLGPGDLPMQEYVEPF